MSGFVITPWFLTNGTDKITEDWSKSNALDPKFAESLKFLHDLVHVDRSTAYGKGIGDAQFAAKQVAMFSAGHWPVPSIMESGLTNVGVQTMPNNGTQTTAVGIDAIGITQAASNPELAWELIKELAGTDAQATYADTMRNIPTLRSVATTGKFVSFPDNAELFYNSAATAQPIASPPNNVEITTTLLRYVDLYLTNNISLEEATQKLHDEIGRTYRR